MSNTSDGLVSYFTGGVFMYDLVIDVFAVLMGKFMFLWQIENSPTTDNNISSLLSLNDNIFNPDNTIVAITQH